MSANNPNNGQRGPPENSNAPDDAGPPDEVQRRKQQAQSDVEQRRRQRKCQEQANCENQQDRIEAKLDLILDELGVEY